MSDIAGMVKGLRSDIANTRMALSKSFEKLEAAFKEKSSPRPTPPQSPTPTPTPKPAPMPDASEGSRPSDSNLAGILDRHNKYRCMHGLPLLKWSKEIEKNARAWAQATGGKMKHSSSQSRKGVAGHSYLGENLAYGAIDKKGVDLWYDEIKLTPGGKGTISGFTKGTGHYTQVVWKRTTELGCAVNGRLLVCQYGVGGNMRGQFTQNVPTLKKSSSQCPDGGGGGGGGSSPRPTPRPSPSPRP